MSHANWPHLFRADSHVNHGEGHAEPRHRTENQTSLTMNARRCSSPSIDAWARALCGCTCAALLSGGLDLASAQEAKTLTRLHDPVILTTARLTDLPTRDTAGYRLYRVQQGRLTPIPFQFDERDGAGDIVFNDTETNGEFQFDDNDELIFMAKDTGDRLATELLPAISDTAIEIEVTDPVTDARGWVYLLHFSGSVPPSSPVTYVRFDAETNRARTSFYAVDNYPGHNFFTGLRIATARGGTDENILERIRLRVHPTFSIFLSTWSPLFTEEDFSARIDGVKNGPIRAIRRARVSLNLGRYFPEMPSGTAYTYYYLSSFTTPSIFSAPWLALKALQNFQFAVLSEFRDSASKMIYRDAANPKDLPFSERTQGAEVVTDTDHDWYVVGGKPGTYLQAFMIPEQWKEWGIVRGAVVRSEPPTAGYSLLNMANLRKPGHYHLNMAFVILTRPYQTGDEIPPLVMLQHPLRSQAKILPRRAEEKWIASVPESPKTSMSHAVLP